jgi:hypothetical protein
MKSREVKVPLSVQIPASDDDHPSWIKVGVIAALGFLIGVAWPRLAGVRLGPSAPSDVTASAASAAPRAGEVAPTARASAPRGDSACREQRPRGDGGGGRPLPPSQILIKSNVMTCRTDDGETAEGGFELRWLPGFDAIALPKLRKLSVCGRRGAVGKLTA